MIKTNRMLNVFMNGEFVGILTKYSHGGLSFHYVQNWLQQVGARPISLSLPLTNQKYIGDVVYNFFDNLLPDNNKIRARIQAKFHITTGQPFDMLASIGQDCVGAIQICSNKQSSIGIKKIDAIPLNHKEIATILNNFKTAPLGMMDKNEDFRISIAGAQEKTAFLLHNKRWYRPLGATPTTHIFKLPIGFIEHHGMDLATSCENEWLCARIAKAFGFPVANSNIQKFENAKALVVERFDRQWSQDNTWIMRLPQEDFCQALGYSSNLKYESDGGPGIIESMQLLLNSEHTFAERELFFRSQILFFLLAAIDGHGKNFSLFIKALGNYSLTPLYDIMSAHPLLANKQLQTKKIKMAMALIGKNKHYLWYTIKRRHFIATAIHAKFSAKNAEEIIQNMLSEVEPIIKKVSNDIPHDFPEHMVNDVFTGMRKAKLMLEN